MGEKVSLGHLAGGGAGPESRLPPSGDVRSPRLLPQTPVCPPAAQRSLQPLLSLPPARGLQRCVWHLTVRVCIGAGSGAPTTMEGQKCLAQAQGCPVWSLQPQSWASEDGTRR